MYHELEQIFDKITTVQTAEGGRPAGACPIRHGIRGSPKK